MESPIKCVIAMATVGSTIMIRKSYRLFLLCVVLKNFTVNAQNLSDRNALMVFFENNYDSTVIYHSGSPWHPGANYDIVAKKANQLYFFTYKNPSRSAYGRTFPGDLELKFLNDQHKFESVEPDTNQFFLFVSIPSNKRQPYWAKLKALGVWRLKEVDYSSITCDSESDAGADTFYLIAKQCFRALTYYDAAFLQSCTPPNVQLKNAFKIGKTFSEIFSGCH